MTITRYRPDSDEQDRTAMMWEDKEGDYVAFEDYEDEVAELESKCDGYRNGQQQMQSIASGLMDSNAKLAADNKRLRNALSLLTSFIPIGWAMPLGFNQVVAQAKEALTGQEAV